MRIIVYWGAFLGAPYSWKPHIPFANYPLHMSHGQNWMYGDSKAVWLLLWFGECNYASLGTGYERAVGVAAN